MSIALFWSNKNNSPRSEMFPSPEAEQLNLRDSLAAGTVTKNTFLLACYTRRKDIFPWPIY